MDSKAIHQLRECIRDVTIKELRTKNAVLQKVTHILRHALRNEAQRGWFISDLDIVFHSRTVDLKKFFGEEKKET